MARVIAIATGVGFVTPIALLIAVWGFTLTNHESLISGEWFSTLSVLICPPSFVQFTTLAPFLNAALYASGAYIIFSTRRFKAT
jgi:hypothetical protein